MYSIRLRGIYATALAALVLHHRWRVVQPTPELQPYLATDDRFAPFDLDIQSRPDKHGITAIGAPEPLDALKELFFAELLDVICVPALVEPGAIYLGIVHKRRAQGYEIDLGELTGFLPQTELARPLRRGEAIPVQIKELASPHPLVTTHLSVAGQFVVLSQEPGVGISKEITDPQERERLLALGQRSCTNGWGVIWRTSAYRRDSHELVREVKRLQRELPKLSDHPEEGIPGKLLPGQSALLVEFPGASKQALDQWRARLIPTELGYHAQQIAPITRNLAQGDPIAVEHVKVQGDLIVLTGRVVSASPQHITVRRDIKSPGLYDGLALPKEPGDYAVTEFRRNTWHYETRYYSCDGRLKGIYININTPIEIYSDRVRYIDLELDVVQRPGEPAQIIDEMEFLRIAPYVSRGALERARASAADCARLLDRV